MFLVPTLAQLRARGRSAVEQGLGLGPLLDRSVLGTLSDVSAGHAHLLHGHLEALAESLIPDTVESVLLERWANLFGIVRIEAVAATGSIDCTGTDGSTIPVGSTLRQSSGIEYETTSSATIAGGTASVAVKAVVRGSSGNAPAGTAVAFASAVSGVASAAGRRRRADSRGGADRETSQSLLDRLLGLLRDPPMGGAAADYVAWARGVPDVTRAFAQPAHLGLGTVGVQILTDDLSTGPLPTAGKVAEVQAYIDERRPVTAMATVYAPAALALDPTVELVGADTAAIRASVEASLEDLVLELGGPSRSIPLSRINEAISNAEGEQDHVLTSPGADVVSTSGQVHVLGTLTFLP